GAEHPHRFVVLSLGDLTLGKEHVAEPFLRDAAGRKNDIAVFHVQALFDAIFFEAQDTRFPGNSQEFKNIRQAQGGELTFKMFPYHRRLKKWYSLHQHIAIRYPSSRRRLVGTADGHARIVVLENEFVVLAALGITKSSDLAHAEPMPPPSAGEYKLGDSSVLRVSSIDHK